MQTVRLDGQNADDVASAAAILARGGVVALPSETVYGLGADASIPAAVARVFAAKGRPADHPLILHVPDIAHARAASRHWPESAEILGRTFWPGALTLVVPKADRVDDAVTGGQDSVALRVPDHAVFLDVIRRLDSIGVAAPSANRFGHVSPTTADHVLHDLGGVIDAVLDAGPCRVGVESTIVDCTVSPPRILRPGGISTEDIDVALQLADSPTTAESPQRDSGVRASGMLESHYAPRARVVLVEDATQSASVAATLGDAGERVVVLEFDSDVATYARELFARLRRADSQNPDVIVAVLPTDTGLGRAVRDRLFKAAATR